MIYKGFLVVIAMWITGHHMGHARDKIVNVTDFGAFPDDSKCDINAIKQALEHAKTVGAKALVFEAGTYDLFVGDVTKNTAIEVTKLHDFTMRGSKDSEGNPATTFLRHYDFRNDMYGKPILSVRECNNFRLQHVIFDNAPRYSTAGEVIANDGQSVTVKIFEGNPVIDGTLFFTSNIWDLSTKTLKKAESPTYGGDVYKKKEEYTWHVEGDPAERIMKLNSPTVASGVEVGEGLSWHFSYKGVQVNFYGCHDLFVENVWTYNAIGFCMQAQACENITAGKIKIMAPDNQLAVGSRDGWKLYACRGKIVMDELYMEGVRWDGQNVHGSFLSPYRVINKNTIWLKKKKGAILPIPEGSKIGFWNGREEVLCTVRKSVIRPIENKGGFLLTFEENIPDFVTDKTLCQIYGWNIDHYALSNSEFRNIAGSASLIRNTDVTIVNNTFDHIMYPAIMIGAAINEGEGVVPKNVRIENNRISHSGWMARYGITGAIGIRNQEKGEKLVFFDKDKAAAKLKKKSPPLTNIQIIGNTIMYGEKGIVASGTLDLLIKGNVFRQVEETIVADRKSNPGMLVTGNE
ncbi:hypothetical protein ED312_00825 [Sinomicrobium pectinilyticum]|uniref:Right-handed parallel beta-helix repeat-containing protein n=1 Tax=Sinomicrobium pectinilyticum TaxID=1084421 RepID=A0A3N0F545_SINP1|nr:right-handed parallel beta-helix repeat-containing protein [Sinomicrobium pectinilyticum]RNL95175.1 hypothetical protein ED312_00825 [Sinomicrobium pectinilyticum]